MSEEDMSEDSSRMPIDAHRRSSDRPGMHRFFRFDSTVSMGTIIQIGSIVVMAVLAYGAYREDQTKTKAEIEAVRVSATHDREEYRSGVADMRGDIKDVKDRMGSIDKSLTILQATTQMQMQQQQQPPRR